ncbi:dolichyl-phosphate beta-glucosyltransferase [Caldicellulosiruptoraceae bacterium PP1]
MRGVLVVPAYNEALRLPEKLLEWQQIKKEFHVILVDDGSDDITSSIAKKMGFEVIRLKKNMGKGYAVRVGMLRALNYNPDFIIFSDADLSVSYNQWQNLIKYIDSYDVIVASRHLKGAVVDRSFKRKLMSKVFSFIANDIFNLGIKDTQCGLKIFNISVVKDLFEEPFMLNKFAFDVELLLRAKKKKYRILEMPVEWKEVKNSKVNSIKTSIEMFLSLFKLYKKINLWR